MNNQTSIPQNHGLVYNIVTNLTFWVLIALIAAVLLGHFQPDVAVKMEIIGKTFIDILKVFIVPIIS
jgi:aerobic C4-dicarboxylate transport protein